MRLAFIRTNSPELRKRIEDLGIHVCVCASWIDSVWLNTCTNGSVHGVGYWDETCPYDNIEDALKHFLLEAENYIDCGTDEELFLKILQE